MSTDPHQNFEVVRSATAGESIGWDDGPFRIRGGRAIYAAVMYNCATRGDQVKLARLDPGRMSSRGLPALREVSRYVDMDTVLEFLKPSQPG